MNKETLERVDYSGLIKTAINEEGKLSDCYELFHNYSILNTLYILRQLCRKNIPIAPVKGYKAWEKLNRKVKSYYLRNKTRYGFPQAIEILFPVFGYYPVKDENGQPKLDKDGKQVLAKYVKTFTYNRWHFAVSQTEVIDPAKETETMTENKFKIDINNLCDKLNITLIPFDKLDGNVQGFARPHTRELAINPVASSPVETAIHEVAHIVLKHHEANYPRDIKEVEAETVTYIVLSVCNNDVDLTETRGYIQHWLGNNTLTDEVAKRIINGASEILNTLK